MKNIGEILKNAREDHDMTQIQVMKATGINNKTLSGYENGIAEPDLDTLITLFKLYKLSANDIFHLTDETESINVSEEEYLVLKEYRKLEKKQREDILKVLKVLNQQTDI